MKTPTEAWGSSIPFFEYISPLESYDWGFQGNKPKWGAGHQPRVSFPSLFYRNLFAKLQRALRITACFGVNCDAALRGFYAWHGGWKSVTRNFFQPLTWGNERREGRWQEKIRRKSFSPLLQVPQRSLIPPVSAAVDSVRLCGHLLLMCSSRVWIKCKITNLVSQMD